MTDPRLTEARALKKKATALRNRSEFTRAQATLDEAIRMLQIQNPDHELVLTDAKEVRAELADTYGMKGGVYRRSGEPDAALSAYATGAAIEENENLSTTYNRSNLITLSITQKGLAPSDDAMRTHLTQVIEHLDVETAGPRSDEWWAWSDLAQFCLLAGQVDKARTCYASAVSKTGASAEEIKRHTTILGELADKIADTAPQITANIRTAINELSAYM